MSFDRAPAATARGPSPPKPQQHRSSALKTNKLHAGREAPLFTSRLPAHSAYEEPRFMTDSLNTSFAPSPSPARRGSNTPQNTSPSRQGSAIPRPSAGSSGRAARESERARRGEPAALAPSKAAPERRGALYAPPYRRSPGTTPNRSPTPLSGAAGQAGGQDTPPRGRPEAPLESPASNASEASPPRELGESYRRINDEEVLAHQQGSGSEGDPAEADDSLPEHLRSPTPSSRRSSRRASAQPEQEPHTEEGSGSGRSSPFDEITPEDIHARDDSDGSRRSDPRQDRARLQSMIAAPPLFSKARPLRSSLFADERREPDAPGSASSSSSKGSGPAQGQPAPVTWGRKARRVGPWLDRIREPATQAPSKEEAAGAAAQWAAGAAGEPNHTQESDSFHPDDTDDMAVAGKQLSSALSNLPPRTEAEEESAKPWVARLDAIRARERAPDPEDEILDDLAREHSASDDILQPATSEDRAPKPSMPPLEPKFNSHTEREGTLTNGSSPSEEEEVRGIVQSIEVDERAQPAATHPKNDSWELLRELSRLESKSPSPVSVQRTRLIAEERQASSKLKQEITADSPLKNHSKREEMRPAPSYNKPTAPPKVEDTPAQPASKLLAKTPRVVGGWIDTPATKQVPAATQELAQGLKALQDSIRAADPKAVSATAKMVEQLPVSAEELEATAPKLKTALEEILDKAKADRTKRENGEDVDSTVLIDDSTLQSLEDLLGTPESTGPIPRANAAPPKEADAPGKAARTAVSKRRSQEAQENAPGPASKAYQSLVSRLNHLGAHISDSRESMTALQRRVSKFKDEKLVAKAVPEGDEDRHECDEAGEMHDFILVCPKCGSGGDPTLFRSPLAAPQFVDWHAVKLPVPRLWERRNDGGMRLTGRGAAVLAGAALLLANYAVDAAYSPPFYAARMDGFGVDYNQARPPFVLFKQAWTKGLAAVVLPLWFGICVLVRFVAAVCGFDPWVFGHADGVPPAAVVHTPEAFDMGFGADEIL